MAEIKEILALMRKLAPENMTEPGFEDSVGLMIGSGTGTTGAVLCCLDCTEKTVGEAAEKGAGLIISHHPAIFRSIERVICAVPAGRTAIAAVRAGISVYSAHTNLDFCGGGINDYFAELLGLTSVEPMHITEGVKVGRIGSLEKPVSLGKYASGISKIFSEPFVKISGSHDRLIKRVACVNGAGGSSSFVDEAASLGADCYVSGEFSHHTILHAAESGISLIEIGHFCSEHIYIPRLVSILSGMAAAEGMDVKFLVSDEKNPITRS